MFQINCLVTESQPVHLLTGTSENYIHDGPAIRLLAFTSHLLIRVNYSTAVECLLDPLGNTFCLVYRLHDTSPCYLKIEMLSGTVIVATF